MVISSESSLNFFFLAPVIHWKKSSKRVWIKMREQFFPPSENNYLHLKWLSQSWHFQINYSNRKASNNMKIWFYINNMINNQSFRIFLFLSIIIMVFTFRTYWNINITKRIQSNIFYYIIIDKNWARIRNGKIYLYWE